MGGRVKEETDNKIEYDLREVLVAFDENDGNPSMFVVYDFETGTVLMSEYLDNYDEDIDMTTEEFKDEIRNNFRDWFPEDAIYPGIGNALYHNNEYYLNMDYIDWKTN